MAEHHFELFADYFQLLLQDEEAELAEHAAGLWKPEAFQRMLDVTPGAIYVGTARNMTVPLTVLVGDCAPPDDADGWDRVNECSIEVPSGRLVVTGVTDYFPDAARIGLAPGCYRARVYYGGLDTLSEDELEGDDRYRVVLWPAPYAEPAVLKERPGPPR